MKKIFKSKLAFIAFVILFTSFLAFFYKDSVSTALWAGSVGGLVGFVFAQWYWVEKNKEIQHLLDARMASPEQAELLKRKDDELFNMSKNNSALVSKIAELQRQLTELKKDYQTVSEEREYLANLVATARQARDAAYISESNEKGRQQ
jgi:hypothetical protein